MLSHEFSHSPFHHTGASSLATGFTVWDGWDRREREREKERERKKEREKERERMFKSGIPLSGFSHVCRVGEIDLISLYPPLYCFLILTISQSFRGYLLCVLRQVIERQVQEMK